MKQLVRDCQIKPHFFIWPHLLILRAYIWLCSQASFLDKIRGPSEEQGTNLSQLRARQEPFLKYYCISLLVTHLWTMSCPPSGWTIPPNTVTQSGSISAEPVQWPNEHELQEEQALHLAQLYSSIYAYLSLWEINPWEVRLIIPRVFIVIVSDQNVVFYHDWGIFQS